MKMQKGFTLVELMIVVIIIGILFSFAIPSYQDYLIKGKLVEATSALSQGRVRMEQFFQDNRAYNAAGYPCPAPTGNFTYSCTVPAITANSYTITATGNAGGPTAGFAYTINESNLKTSTTNWGNGATCWITKKGTTC